MGDRKMIIALMYPLLFTKRSAKAIVQLLIIMIKKR